MKLPDCGVAGCPNPGVARINGEQVTFICDDHFKKPDQSTDQSKKPRAKPRAKTARRTPKPKEKQPVVQAPRSLISSYTAPINQPSITQKTATGLLSNQYIRFGAPVGVFLLVLLIVMNQASGNQDMTKQLNNFSSIGLYGFFLVVGFYLGHRAKKDKVTIIEQVKQ